MAAIARAEASARAVDQGDRVVGTGARGVEEASTTAKAEPTIVEAIEAEGSEARVREVDREAAEARVPVDSPGLRRHGEGPRMK